MIHWLKILPHLETNRREKEQKITNKQKTTTVHQLQIERSIDLSFYISWHFEATDNLEKKEKGRSIDH